MGADRRGGSYAVEIRLVMPRPRADAGRSAGRDDGGSQMSVHGHWSHEIDLKAQASSAAEARNFVTRHLLVHEVAYLVDDIQMVASELATNAIVHARTPFTVTLGALGDFVRLEVRDGSNMGPSLVVVQTLHMGGRGIAIVHALSRDWGVIASISGGKSVWAEFNVRGVSLSKRGVLTGRLPKGPGNCREGWPSLNVVAARRTTSDTSPIRHAVERGRLAARPRPSAATYFSRAPYEHVALAHPRWPRGGARRAFRSTSTWEWATWRASIVTRTLLAPCLHSLRTSRLHSTVVRSPHLSCWRTRPLSRRGPALD